MEGFNLGSIVAHIKADTSQFTAAIEEAKMQSGGLSGALGVIGGVAKVAAVAIAATGAAVAGFGAISVKAFMESQNIQAQLNAALESTHHAAGLYINDLNEQAKALQRVTKFTDEQINSSQALLLTFTNIHGAVFQEATPAILDLAQAMHEDLQSATIQVGKALNDPVLGITALHRIGVTFSETQKEQIKNFMDTNQQAKAQGIILAELNKEFGGSAVAAGKTFGGQLTILKNQLNDVEEQVGEVIVKALTPFALKAIKAVESIDWTAVINKTLATISRFYNDIKDLYDLMDKYLVPGITRFIEVLKEVFNILETYLGPSLQTLINTISERLMPQIIKLWNVIEPGFTTALKGLGIVLGVLLVASMWIFINVLNVTITIIGGLIHWIELAIGWFGNLGGVIINVFRGIPNAIMDVFSGAGHWLYQVGRDIVQGLINGVKDMAGQVTDTVRNVGSSIKDVAKKILGVFSPSTVFHEIGMNVGQGLVNGMNSMQDAISNASGQMALSAVAPASSVVNNSPTNNQSSISTSIGTVNIGSNVDATKFLKTLTRNQELAQKGLTPVR